MVLEEIQEEDINQSDAAFLVHCRANNCYYVAYKTDEGYRHFGTDEKLDGFETPTRFWRLDYTIQA